jgi:hypothetical protein
MTMQEQLQPYIGPALRDLERLTYSAILAFERGMQVVDVEEYLGIHFRAATPEMIDKAVMRAYHSHKLSKAIGLCGNGCDPRSSSSSSQSGVALPNMDDWNEADPEEKKKMMMAPLTTRQIADANFLLEKFKLARGQ